jgi:hypothetical protein
MFTRLKKLQGRRKDATVPYLRVMFVALFVSLAATVGLFTGAEPRTALGFLTSATSSDNDTVRTPPDEPVNKARTDENGSKSSHAGPQDVVELTVFTHIPTGANQSKFRHAGTPGTTHDRTTFRHSSVGANNTRFFHAGSQGTVAQSTFKHIPQGANRSKFAHAGIPSGTHDRTTFLHSSVGGANNTKFFHAGSQGTVAQTTFKHIAAGPNASRWLHAHSGAPTTHNRTTFLHSTGGANNTRFFHAGTVGPVPPPN